ncbi:MAG: site-specific integrase, partial [Atopobium sp.]|nr:site-specific integrase [Atopobium sp.]
MAEYSPGGIRKCTNHRKWEGFLRYRDTPADTWHTKTKTFDIACDEQSQRGEARARTAFTSWRKDFVQKHDSELTDGISPDVKTVGEYVTERVTTLKASESIEPSTVRSYERMTGYVVDGLGGIALDDLTPETVQAWVTSMTEEYAPTTVRHAYTRLKEALTHAVETDRLAKNPTVGVKLPKLQKTPKNPLDYKEYDRLMGYLDNIAVMTPANIGIKMAMLTGMREGEICGLRWRDVDLDKGVIYVRSVIGRGDGKSYEKEPKTTSGRRGIPIAASFRSDLITFRASVVSDCETADVPFEDSLFVLGAIDGSYMNPYTLWLAWHNLAGSLGIKGVLGTTPCFHDLRHTFATHAVRQGTDVKTLSSILGHASAAMTLDIYADADPD